MCHTLGTGNCHKVTVFYKGMPVTPFVDILRERIPYPVFTDVEVTVVFPDSANRRHALMKRALARGDLIRLKRGVYTWGRRYQKGEPSLFDVAQRLYPPSYVSLESALAFHGWIPEAVYTVTSVCQRRSRTFSTPAARFRFHRNPSFGFRGVERVQDGKALVLVASPTKALADYIKITRPEAPEADAVFGSLRIDPEAANPVDRTLLAELINDYQDPRLERFFASFPNGAATP